MTRKHYVKLADALKHSQPSNYTTATTPAHKAENEQWLHSVKNIASACASDNGRFDRGRFLTACGV